jgi:hypothetical protein
MPVFHKNLTDENLHQPGYFQASDPSAIGAGKLWVDTGGDSDTTPDLPTADHSFKVRNAANTGWIIPNTFNGIKISANVAGAGDEDQLFVTRYRNSTSVPSAMTLRSANGTKASPTAVLNTNIYGRMRFAGAGNTTPVWVTGAEIYAKAFENFSTTAAGSGIFFDVATLTSVTLTTAMIVYGGAAGATAVNITGTFDHDGGFVGFYGAAPVARQTYGAPTGTATRTTFATDSVTLIELARRVKAIVDDLRSVGLFA